MGWFRGRGKKASEAGIAAGNVIQWLGSSESELWKVLAEFGPQEEFVKERVALESLCLRVFLADYVLFVRFQKDSGALESARNELEECLSEKAAALLMPWNIDADSFYSRLSERMLDYTQAAQGAAGPEMIKVLAKAWAYYCATPGPHGLDLDFNKNLIELEVKHCNEPGIDQLLSFLTVTQTAVGVWLTEELPSCVGLS